MNRMNQIRNRVITCVWMIIFLSLTKVHAQTEYQWLSIGDLHNFYGSIGHEIEEGFIKRQQAGLQWPAIYDRQDIQAAKAMWLGARNHTDASGQVFDYRVIHVGPRATGLGIFVPVQFDVIPRFPEPLVFVDGAASFDKQADLVAPDPTIPADRMIVNVVNTALGITMERKIYAYAQEYHDDYHIIELTFTNTGNVDDDADIELQGQTVTDFVLYLQNRWSVSRQTRYTIGNATGWGINTMNDRRGDGINTPDQNPTEEQLVAQFAWHGYFPGFSPPGAPNDFDNIGGPIWNPSATDGLSAADTVGRLGSYHFVGKIHLDAPLGSGGEIQPLTMSELGSDDGLNFRNDAFNATRMQQEYQKMIEGRTQRHAYLVEPTGLDGFLDPKTDPSLGTSGGMSATTGYGPYTLAFGESVTIVYAEAVGGISRKQAEVTGKQFKSGLISNLQKNQVVFQGRDSLFMTFERAIDTYNNNYQIVNAPPPPASFTVNSGGDGIYLEWEFDAASESEISGFEIYRSAYVPDSTAYLLGMVNASERTFVDNDFTAKPAGPPVRGRDYYYFIVSVSANQAYAGQQLSNFSVNGDLYYDKKLRSSRYFTQTYTEARLQRQPGESMSQIVIVPNPYIASSSDNLRFNLGNRNADRIAFFEIPGRCKITIYTEIGEKIKEIVHTNGSGDDFWDLRTDARQRIVSGIYIAIIENMDTKEKVTKKFVVIL